MAGILEYKGTVDPKKGNEGIWRRGGCCCCSSFCCVEDASVVVKSASADEVAVAAPTVLFQRNAVFALLALWTRVDNEEPHRPALVHRKNIIFISMAKVPTKTKMKRNGFQCSWGRVKKIICNSTKIAPRESREDNKKTTTQKCRRKKRRSFSCFLHFLKDTKMPGRCDQNDDDVETR